MVTESCRQQSKGPEMQFLSFKFLYISSYFMLLLSAFSILLLIYKGI